MKRNRSFAWPQGTEGSGEPGEETARVEILYVPGSYLGYFTITRLVICLSSKLQMFCSKKR